MIDFISTNYVQLVAAYAVIYVTYVIYALFAIRFGKKRRVDKDDFTEVCGEAVIGPIILPCRLIKHGLQVIQASILAMVNAGLPPEVRK